MFRYGYAVTDDQGLDFNQQETSDGGVVTGSYSVVLPDGRIQTVTYSVAPDTGYVVSSAHRESLRGQNSEDESPRKVQLTVLESCNAWNTGNNEAT